MEINSSYEKVFCDKCGREIPKRMFYINDGFFQADSLRFGEKDLCLGCCSLVLEKLFEENLAATEENINGVIG